MNALIENFTTVIRNSLNFSGRASRGEYWWFAAVVVAAGICLRLIDSFIGIPVLSIVFMLVMLLPGIAVAIRRLHDSDRSGWWLLVGLVPFVGAVAVLVLTMLAGTNGKNRFGDVATSPDVIGQRPVGSTA